MQVTDGNAAAFGRLCVETSQLNQSEDKEKQPPSGGCVLKQIAESMLNLHAAAAAFGRLCVETLS